MRIQIAQGQGYESRSQDGLGLGGNDRKRRRQFKFRTVAQCGTSRDDAVTRHAYVRNTPGQHVRVLERLISFRIIVVHEQAVHAAGVQGILSFFLSTYRCALFCCFARQKRDYCCLGQVLGLVTHALPMPAPSYHPRIQSIPPPAPPRASSNLGNGRYPLADAINNNQYPQPHQAVQDTHTNKRHDDQPPAVPEKQQERERGKNDPPLPRQNAKVQPPTPPPVIRDKSRALNYERVGFLGQVSSPFRKSSCGPSAEKAESLDCGYTTSLISIACRGSSRLQRVFIVICVSA